MKLDAQIQWVLTLSRKVRTPPVWQLDPVAARAQYEKSAPVLDFRHTAVHRCEALLIPTHYGNLPARLVIPRDIAPGEKRPLVVFFHGGGFVIGSLETHRGLYTRLAREADCLLLAVDYRLAPEHPFPAGVEDALTALTYVFQHADALGADASRIAVAGDSAGATLSAVCALEARNRGLPLRHQLLIYPGTAAAPDSASHFSLAEGYLLDRRSILWFYRHYLGQARQPDWRFAPLLAPSLTGVAPTTLVVAEADPLRDEGLAYARRLQAAGVAVSLQRYAGMIHGFISMGGMVVAAREAVHELGKQLGEILRS